MDSTLSYSDTFIYTACFFSNLLRRYIGALLHERAYGEPERVQQGELVLEDFGLPVARMGVLPLVGAEPADRWKGKDRH